MFRWTVKNQINEEIQEIRQRVDEIHSHITGNISCDSSCDIVPSMGEIADKLNYLEDKMENVEYIVQGINDFLPSLNLEDLTHLHRQLQVRSENNENMYKKAEVLVNEVKGMLCMMRAVLSASKKKTSKPSKSKSDKQALIQKS